MLQTLPIRTVFTRLLVLAGLMLGLAFNAEAHNRNTTTVLFTPLNGIWTARFAISTEGAEYAMAQFYKDIDLKLLPPEEYKRLLINYIKHHTQLYVDGTGVDFGSGSIKLDDHKIEVRLLLPTFPKSFTKLQLVMTVFEENERQNTIVRFRNAEKSALQELNHHDGFSLNLIDTAEGFEITQDMEMSAAPYYILAAILLMACVLVLYRRAIKRQATQQPDLPKA